MSPARASNVAALREVFPASAGLSRDAREASRSGSFGAAFDDPAEGLGSARCARTSSGSSRLWRPASATGVAPEGALRSRARRHRAQRKLIRSEFDRFPEAGSGIIRPCPRCSSRRFLVAGRGQSDSMRTGRQELGEAEVEVFTTRRSRTSGFGLRSDGRSPRRALRQAVCDCAAIERAARGTGRRRQVSHASIHDEPIAM